MVLRQPVLEARWQQVGLVSITGEEVEGHGISSGDRITYLSFSPLPGLTSTTSRGFLQTASSGRDDRILVTAEDEP